MLWIGNIGENIVTQGIPYAQLNAGDHLVFGCGAELEITIVRKGCAHLNQIDERLPEAIQGRSGWMAKVIFGGILRSGDTVSVLQ